MNLLKISQRILNEKLNLTQERISKLIDMHIDGKIDAETYHFKLGEYKTEQQNFILEIKSYELILGLNVSLLKRYLELHGMQKRFL